MANFRINVIIDPSGARRGGRATRRELGNIQKSAQKTNRLLTTLFTFAAVATGIRVLAGFAQALSTVEAISGATATEIQQITDVARELGATTRFSATQAAEAFLFLARAGFTVVEQLESVGATLLLAQSGALDLGTAADIASNVLTAFRLEAGEAARVVDVLAVAANSSNTNVQQLGDGLKLVAPIAAGVGVSLEETTAAIGNLSDAGLQATLAGTGLRRIISELESPSTKTRKVLTQLGLTTADVRISQVGLTEAILRLKDAGIDTGIALELFGDRGGPAFEVLQNAIPGVIELTAKLQNSEGAARRIAEVMDDNLNGALLATKSALEAVLLSLGELGLTRALTTTLRSVATALRFMADNAQILVGVLTVLSVRVIPAAIQALLRMGIAAAIALGPIGIIAIALGAAAGALVAFSDDITFGTEKIISLGDIAKATFEFLSDVVQTAIDSIRESFARLLTFLDDTFGPVFGAVLGAIASIIPSLDDVLGAVRTFINRFIGTFVGAGRALAVIFDAIFGGINDAFVALFGENIVAVISSVVDFGKRALSTIGSVATRILNAVGIAGGQVASAIGETFDLPDLVVPKTVLDFGIKVSDAFLSGFNQDFVGDFLAIIDPAFDRISDRAEELARKRISLNIGVDDTGGGAGEDVVAPPDTRDRAFEAVIRNLEREAALLMLTSQQREIAAGVLEIEEELARELTETELRLVEAHLLENQLLSDQGALVEQIIGPMTTFQRGQEALNELFKDGTISLGQYNQALIALELNALQAETSLSAGLRRGLLSITQSASDTATQVESLLVGAFDRASTALADFASNGSASFRDFASSIIADIARIAAQQLLLSTINALFPGAQIPAFQHGGGFRVGGSGGADSQLVAFRASPMENVTITPPGQQSAPQEPPVVNVPPAQVVIVDSIEKAMEFIQSGEADDGIIASLERQSQAVRTIAGT